MRYELTGFEWAAIRSFLPNKPRGIPRANGTIDIECGTTVNSLSRQGQVDFSPIGGSIADQKMCVCARRIVMAGHDDRGR